MRERAALVILAGDVPNRTLVRQAAKSCRGILCADGGGLRQALRLKLRPDFVIGDMDSLPSPLPRDKRLTYWCDFDENRSDFEKALEFAAGMGCARVYVAGALGGATDHALINLAVFARYARALELVLLDRGTGRLVGPGRYRLRAPRGARFSLLAYGGARVTLSGALYPLRRFALAPGARGLGNRSAGSPTLTVHEGWVWVFR